MTLAAWVRHNWTEALGTFLLRGFDIRKADIGAGVATAYVLLLENTEEGKRQEVVNTIRTRPTVLSKAIESATLPGDEIVPTMVPSWWTGDDDAFSEAQGAAAFFRGMPKGGGD